MRENSQKKSLEQQRIAELEQEVAQLRQERTRKEPTVETDAAVLTEPSELIKELGRSKLRGISVGASVLLIALCLTLAIFAALSRGFGLFADKAAETMAPSLETESSSEAGEDEQVPRIPGL